MRQVNLDAAKYGEFLRCLSLLKEDCNDADIREGIIRQRSNEKVSIFEIDLNDIVSGLSLPISDLKQKFDLLKIFEEQEVVVEVNEEDNPPSFSFSDQYSSLKFKAPRLDFMDNKFMSEEEMNSSFTLEDEDMILSTTVSKNMSDRIKAITRSFHVNSIRVVFEGDSATLITATMSKDMTAKLMDGIVTDRELNCISNIVAVPFVVDHDSDIDFKMYNVRDNLVVSKFSTTVGSINTVIYTRSNLIEEEPEGE